MTAVTEVPRAGAGGRPGATGSHAHPERSAPSAAAGPGDGSAGTPSARSTRALTTAVAAVVVTACLPLARVFVGLDFLRPVLGAALLALGVSWACRRLGGGPLLTLLASTIGWIAFVGVAFLGDTLTAGVLPTPATLEAGRDMWLRGLELVRIRPSPAFADAPLLLLAVTGVWAVAHGVDGLVFCSRAPLKAVAMAMVLWTVPLALAPSSARPWAWACPFLAAAGVLLLAFSGADLERWGSWVDPWTGRTGRFRAGTNPLAPAGGTITAVAIVTGVVAAGLLPGYGEPPWYRVRGLGGTTLTDNPIVGIRSSLVARDTGPVMRVRTERPVYLRTTSLDVYSPDEEWTNAGIRGRPVHSSGRLDFETAVGAEYVTVEVTVVDLPGAVLVPAPYQAVQVAGPVTEHFNYDRRVATFTLDPGTAFSPNERYLVRAAVPTPDADTLSRLLVVDPADESTTLPANVPPAVRELALDIVQRARAVTPFQQALAVQNELRRWQYSLEIPEGHSGTAMEAFIDRRSGYCEQFAGTMAVMLRTLGIPARVAVGFTPGTPVGGGEYVVTNANAHAWVEVLFPGQGWISFEPTPRDDGNVLVPTAVNLAPAMTAAQQAAQAAANAGLTPEQERLAQLPNPGEQAEGLPAPLPAPLPGAAAPDGGRAALPMLLVLLSGLVLVGGVAVGLLRARRPASLAPVARVLRARARVERVGRGLGTAPGPWETDREYLERLAVLVPSEAQAAGDLAALTAAARYAAVLPEDAASAAETAAERLRAALLESLPARDRVLALVRGPVTAWLWAARARWKARREQDTTRTVGV